MALNEALTYLAVDLSEVHVTRFTSQTTCRLQHLCLLPPHYPGVSFSPAVATKEKSTLPVPRSASTMLSTSWPTMRPRPKRPLASSARKGPCVQRVSNGLFRDSVELAFEWKNVT